MLAQITNNNFFYGKTRTKMLSVLAKITCNKLQSFFYTMTKTNSLNVLAQIINNNFFL